MDRNAGAWLGAIAVLAVGTWGSAATAKRGEAAAACVEKGPALDGTMKGPVWEKCPPWPLGACTSENPQKYKTWARVLFDPTHVTVGVCCEEPDTDGLVMNVTQRDGELWQDDSVEIFLRADPERPYCQFVINPRGTLFDARDRQASWNSSAEAKASIEKGKAWTATLRVPLKEIDAYAGENQTWTLNVNRSRQPRGGDPLLEYSWAIMNSNNYQSPQEFGVVKGVNVPRRDDGVTRVRQAPAPKPNLVNKGVEVGGVTVYHGMSFDDGPEGWSSSSGGKVGLTDDAISGKALAVGAEAKWAGAQLPLNVSGSRGLKMAFHIQGRDFPTASLNVFDTVANDNTTSYGPRYLADGRWTPVLYFLDRFRYNSQTTGFVGARTLYNVVRFYGPSEPKPGAQFILDNFVLYRGVDQQPPEKVAGLKAEATAGGVKLSWEPASDNVGTQLYVVARAEGAGPFAKIAESCPTTCLDRAAGKGARRYRVFAVDFEENLGPWSEPVAVESVSDAVAPEPTREETDRLGFAQHVKEVHATGAGKVRRGHATLFGDSLTGATSYPQCAQSAFRTLTVSAFGYAAMRTSFGRDKVGEILQNDNPEFMFVLYGTNNSKAERDLPPAMDDLAAIVKACEARGTVAILGTIPPRGFADAESKPEANYNRHVVALCRKLQIPTGYIFEDFQAAGPRKEFMGGDGVHWQGTGMAVGARAWGKALDQVRFVLRDQD